jgi:2,5-diketo-D-gluconate reductase A
MNASIPLLTLNNGVQIPQLGLGVWKASDDEAEFAVKTALEHGYRLIDTAKLYGNEAGVGRAIRNSGIPREEIFVTTKLWNSDQGYDQALAAFEDSLGRLGLDYVDLYLIHWPVPNNDKYIETWRAFEDLYASGKVKAIGVSNFQRDHLERILDETETPPALNQIELHPDFSQLELRRYCEQENIKVESWSPIGGSGGRLLENPLLRELGDKYGKSPAQIAIRWHIQNGLVVIPKSVHAERIAENIDVFDFELSSDDMKQMLKLDESNRQGPHPEDMNDA